MMGTIQHDHTPLPPCPCTWTHTPPFTNLGVRHSPSLAVGSRCGGGGVHGRF